MSSNRARQRQELPRDADTTEPHLIGRVGTSTLDRHGNARAVNVTTEVHYDVYADELGEGKPLYDAWAIEDDKTGALLDAKYENLGRAAEASAQGRGFRTPAGRPSSNELWRFRVRGCQDCWAALFFFGVLAVVVLCGASELHHLTLTQEMVETIRHNMGLPAAAAAARATHQRSGDGAVGEVNGSAALGGLPDDVVAPRPSLLETLSPLTRKGKKGEKKDKDEAAAPAEITIAHIAFSGWTMRRAGWVLTWSAVSVAVACVGLSILRCMPRFLIILECWVEFGVFASIGLVSCLSGNLFGAVLFAVLSLFPLLWLYLVQDRIPFAVSLLNIAARLVKEHMALVVVSVSAAIVLVLYAMLTLVFALPPLLRAAAEESTPLDGAFVLLLVFALLWVQQVLSNIVHVTASGVLATWYFAGDTYMPRTPVRAALTRATTSSLGSICFGSLFVAIVRFLRFIAQASRASSDDDNFLGCVCDCFLGLLESLLKYFNTYAFVHVAIYGCSYVDAARRTWALTQQCFFAAVFNDCLAYQAVGVLALMLAVGVSIVGGLVCHSFGLALVILVISLFANSIVFQLVQSTVTTLFVCFAEVPEGMEVSFPKLHAELMAMDAMSLVNGVHQRQRESYGTV